VGWVGKANGKNGYFFSKTPRPAHPVSYVTFALGSFPRLKRRKGETNPSLSCNVADKNERPHNSSHIHSHSLQGSIIITINITISFIQGIHTYKPETNHVSKQYIIIIIIINIIIIII
jgi:hypothetical protein